MSDTLYGHVVIETGLVPSSVLTELSEHVDDERLIVEDIEVEIDSLEDPTDGWTITDDRLSAVSRETMDWVRGQICDKIDAEVDEIEPMVWTPDGYFHASEFPSGRVPSTGWHGED